MSDSRTVDDLSFDLLVTFIDVVHTGNMAKTGRFLEKAGSQVGRRIRRLEAWLRYPLFVPESGYTLTFEGEKFYETTINVIKALEGSRGSKSPFIQSEIVDNLDEIFKNSDESRLSTEDERRFINGNVVFTQKDGGPICVD
ncbi:hypothetical protein BH10PLA2_BH10PLA2_03450 [soil metagenome]